MELLKKYYDYTLPNTESPVCMHRWSFLSCVAASLGRNFYLPFGHGVIYPNLLTLLVGAPATRKTSAIRIASRLLKNSGYINVTDGKTSKEKFLEDFSDNFSFLQETKDSDDAFDFLGEDVNDSIRVSEILIAAEEFQNFVGAGMQNLHPFLVTCTITKTVTIYD